MALFYDVEIARQVVLTMTSYYEYNSDSKSLRAILGNYTPDEIRTKCTSDVDFILERFSSIMLYLFPPESLVRNQQGKELCFKAYDTLAKWGYPASNRYAHFTAYAFAAQFQKYFDDKTYLQLRSSLVGLIARAANQEMADFILSSYCPTQLDFFSKLTTIKTLIDNLNKLYADKNYPSIGECLHQAGFTDVQINILGYSR